MTLFCSSKEFDALCHDLRGKADVLRLQVKGGSMFPFINSGDQVELALVKDAKSDIKKGDIVLFRREGNLYLHRVLRRCSKGWLVKGDMAATPDGIIEPQDVLARVVAVEKNGRRVDLGTWFDRTVALVIADVSFILPYLLWPARKLISLGMIFFSRLQSFRVYRRVIKKILNVSVHIRPAVLDDEEQLRDLYLMAGHDIRVGIAGIKKEGFWLIAERKNKIVGGLTVSRDEKNAELWIIFGLEVKPWLRGLGTGEELVREAIKKAKESRAVQICLFVDKKATPALALYRKLGFVVTDEVPLGFNCSGDELYLAKRIHE